MKAIHFQQADGSKLCRYNRKGVTHYEMTPDWALVTCRDCNHRRARQQSEDMTPAIDAQGALPVAYLKAEWARIGDRLLYSVDEGTIREADLRVIFDHIDRVIFHRHAVNAGHYGAADRDPCKGLDCEVIQ